MSHCAAGRPSPSLNAPPPAQFRVFRAYKLGKKRWSYNEVNLLFGRGDCDGLRIKEAKAADLPQGPGQEQVGRRNPKSAASGEGASPAATQRGSRRPLPYRPRRPHPTALAHSHPIAFQDPSVTFRLLLESGRTLLARVYLVFDDAAEAGAADGSAPGGSAESSAVLGYEAAMLAAEPEASTSGAQQHSW